MSFSTIIRSLNPGLSRPQYNFEPYSSSSQYNTASSSQFQSLSRSPNENLGVTMMGFCRPSERGSLHPEELTLLPHPMVHLLFIRTCPGIFWINPSTTTSWRASPWTTAILVQTPVFGSKEGLQNGDASHQHQQPWCKVVMLWYIETLEGEEVSDDLKEAIEGRLAPPGTPFTQGVLHLQNGPVWIQLGQDFTFARCLAIDDYSSWYNKKVKKQKCLHVSGASNQSCSSRDDDEPPIKKCQMALTPEILDYKSLYTISSSPSNHNLPINTPITSPLENPLLNLFDDELSSTSAPSSSRRTTAPTSKPFGLAPLSGTFEGNISPTTDGTAMSSTSSTSASSSSSSTPNNVTQAATTISQKTASTAPGTSTIEDGSSPTSPNEGSPAMDAGTSAMKVTDAIDPVLKSTKTATTTSPATSTNAVDMVMAPTSPNEVDPAVESPQTQRAQVSSTTDPASKPTVKAKTRKSRIAVVGKAKTAKNNCKREWKVSHPTGTEEDSKLYGRV
ncbi:hypothetical protein BDQ17DRAFT_1436573 [Cyathus striatus]|nr:hypothetical protein BDQ17DRAFT_1436573 [Cyathus striatus]